MKYVYSLIICLLLSAQALAGPTSRIFVTNEQSDTVSVIDGDTNQVEATIEVGKRPRGIGLSPDKSELYVALGADQQDRLAPHRK